MKKIKITKLEKPLEYREREFRDVKIKQKKLLQESDWTQIFDSGLTTIEIITWRIWRLQVRSVGVTIDNYSEAEIELEILSKNMPNRSTYVSAVNEYPVHIFKSINTESIVNTLIEILISIKFDRKDAERLTSVEDKNIKNILQTMDEILDGYRY